MQLRKIAGLLAAAGIAAGTLAPAASADSNGYKALCMGGLAGYDYTSFYTQTGQTFDNQGQCIKYANETGVLYVPYQGSSGSGGSGGGKILFVPFQL